MTNLIRFAPGNDVRRLQNEIDQIFDSFFPTRNGAQNDTEATAWSPRIDVMETEDAYLVHLDVPGMKKDDFQINFDAGVLSLTGERRDETRDEDYNYVRLERQYGRFHRAFTLPKSVKVENINATYTDGVLRVEIPKAEEGKPRRIQVS